MSSNRRFIDFLVMVFVLLSANEETPGTTGVAAVTVTRLSVPRTASHDAPLDCRYDLEGDQLYAVKWYKDEAEFFRCEASGNVMEFPVRGVKLLKTHGHTPGSCFVTLTALMAGSSGEYKCEVSTEAPSFKVASRSARLRVIQPEPQRASLETTTAYTTGGSCPTSSTLFKIHLIIVTICFLFNGI